MASYLEPDGFDQDEGPRRRCKLIINTFDGLNMSPESSRLLQHEKER